MALVGLSIALVLLLNALFHQPPRKAVKGVLDLQGWAFDKQPALLAGDWAFYWNQYKSPDDIEAQGVQKSPGYLNFPGVWNGQEFRTFKLGDNLGSNYINFVTIDKSDRMWVGTNYYVYRIDLQEFYKENSFEPVAFTNMDGIISTETNLNPSGFWLFSYLIRRFKARKMSRGQK